jgi:hypothetical protein
MLTPPEVAKRWGVAADKVNHLINTGQLTAVNLACDPKGRPRWRVSIEEVEKFEQKRSNSPPLPKQKRRRKTGIEVGKEYF